ncbi:sugar-binding transcriptional regulator [Rhodovulum sp. DZ06]|uniref:sugar-binding transcriptional regulator n=1 Tax=Rhodovulum sp. DZ06 TaxID=3425126 RepID=UPI003D3261F4
MAQGGRGDGDDGLSVRAAWLHYVGGLTQAETARRLGVTNVKAHRLIARAAQNGAVKVVIDGEIADCVALEARLSARYGLDYCEVAPEVGPEDPEALPLRALGAIGARFLQRQVAAQEHALIGIGHGRTLAAAVAGLPRMGAGTTSFVSLLGGLTRNDAANPHDVMHRLAEKTGATAYVMPVPFFANTPEDRAVFLSQRGVAEVMEMAETAPLKIVGIGSAQPAASLVAAGMVRAEEIEAIRAEGGVGEMLGVFYAADGTPIETALTARTVAAGLSDPGPARVVALAGGAQKTDAIRSVLRSGRLGGLITDERTAKALVQD